MNKKKLALTLLLSSMSVAVVASSAAVVAPAAAVVAPAAAVVAPAATPVVKYNAVPTTYAEDAKGLYIKNDKGEYVLETPAATPGYAEAAWSAVKSNRAAVAVLVTTCALTGAAIYAAFSSNNTVDADDAE